MKVRSQFLGMSLSVCLDVVRKALKGVIIYRFVLALGAVFKVLRRWRTLADLMRIRHQSRRLWERGSDEQVQLFSGCRNVDPDGGSIDHSSGAVRYTRRQLQLYESRCGCESPLRVALVRQGAANQCGTPH